MNLSVSHSMELILRHPQCEPHIITLRDIVSIPNECVERVQGVRKAVGETGNRIPVVIDWACPRTRRKADDELLYMAGDIGTANKHRQC